MQMRGQGSYEPKALVPSVSCTIFCDIDHEELFRLGYSLFPRPTTGFLLDLWIH